MLRMRTNSATCTCYCYGFLFDVVGRSAEYYRCYRLSHIKKNNFVCWHTTTQYNFQLHQLPVPSVILKFTILLPCRSTRVDLNIADMY
jgi:hypothetical protein